MVSVEVAGQTAKPSLGTDGIRVPLLRAGFRPQGPYTVSFVYLHSGTPFARKGDLQMALPRMDIPVNLVEWEVFFPDRYAVRSIGGNVVERSAFAGHLADETIAVATSVVGRVGGVVGDLIDTAPDARPGEIRGRVTDTNGNILPGVEVVARIGPSQRSAVTSADGMFVLSGVPPGTGTISTHLPGFQGASRSLAFNPQQPRRFDFELRVGSGEAVTVMAEVPVVDLQVSRRQVTDGLRAASPPPPVGAAPSQNVINLQQRASGVLPVRVDVPRAGTSLQFVKPLVVDQETVVNLRYKRR